MKRLRSYDDDPDDDVGEKGSFRDWQRRDQSSDRPASSHRRKPESLRKSSSYDRSLDDDREPSRPLRKRYDYELEGFDRRKGLDRYRDGGDRPVQLSSSSSPRGLYGSDRMHRSESFSGLRREFPKGFRSERDRSRREGSSGSSWRRSTSLKEAAADELKKSPSVDSELAGRRSSRAASPEDHRVRVKSRDSSSGEQQSRRTEAAKVEMPSRESVDRESGNSSEMEEGELEPDLDPKQAPEPVAEPSSVANVEIELEPVNCIDRISQCESVPEAKFEKIDVLLPSENKLEVVDTGKTGEQDRGILTDATMNRKVPSVVESKGEDGANNADGVGEIEGKLNNADRVGEIQGKLCLVEKEIVQKDSFSLPTQCPETVQNKSLSLPPESQECEGNVEGKNHEEEQGRMASSNASLLKEKLDEQKCEERDTEAEMEAVHTAERGKDLVLEKNEGRGIDLEVEPCGSANLLDSGDKVIGLSSFDRSTLKLMADKPKEDYKDKGKSIAMPKSDKRDFMEDDNTTEGPSGRGFELVFRSDFSRSEKVQSVGVVIGKHKDEKPKVESLDLSLSLPCGMLEHPPKDSNSKPDSPNLVRSIQSLPSSFPTNSDGFTTSISFTNSQPFSHNPSCSLTQNSMDNYEHSVGSHPIFQGMDQVSSGPIWQPQSSNETKRKVATPLFQRVLLNGNASHSTLPTLNGQPQSKANGLLRQSTPSSQLSPTNSHGSHDTRSEHSKSKRLLTRERSGSSLFRTDQREGEQLVLNGAGVTEKIVWKIITEPLHLNSRMLLEMTDNSVSYLKQTISEMLMDANKGRQIKALQEALRSRADLSMETLTKCPNILLEILLALKTGLPGFLKRGNTISSSALVEIFLDLRCHNLACQSMLPVDDCDCKVCTQKVGFCSSCMCLVCHKFDNASNTCSWVGCDVCLHWCHTDCGLRDAHIKNGRSASGDKEITEMQFHCIACDHPSEMFGFVKEVFRTCAKEWKVETLAKELHYVRRIFSASNDVRGKRLFDMSGQMLVKLENKANYSEVVSYVLAFLSGSDSNIYNCPPLFPPKEPAGNNAGRSNGIASSRQDATWLQSVPSEKVSLQENDRALSSMDSDRIGRKARNCETQLNMENKPVVDELESVVKFKQAEAKMYQERADDARKEAEGLKRIAVAKNVKIDEDYASRIAKLQLGEAEDRRRQKLEELQAIEKAHHEYFTMKMRMEADIKELLLKMEATRRNLNT